MVAEKYISKLTILGILGISVLILPDMAVNYGNRGVFFLLLAGGCSVLETYFIYGFRKWRQSHPRIYQIIRNLGIFLVFCKYSILFILLVRYLTVFIQYEFVGEVSYGFIVCSLIGIGAYGGSKGMKSMRRIASFTFVLFLLPVLALLLFSLRGCQVTGIKNMFFAGVRQMKTTGSWQKKLLIGSFKVLFLFSPSELLLCEEFRDVKKKKILLSTIVLLGFQLAFYLLCVGKLSIPVMQKEPFSVVKLMENIEIGGRILNKHAGTYLSFFVLMAMFTLCVICSVIFSMIRKGIGQIKGMRQEHTKMLNQECKIAVVGILLLVILFATDWTGRLYPGVMLQKEHRNTIDERRYVDACFMQYDEEHKTYEVFLTFTGEETSGMNFALPKLTTLKSEYAKIEGKELDYSNLQAIIIQKELLEPEKKDVFLEIWTYFQNEKTVYDNAFFFVTDTDLLEFEETYEEKKETMPGKEMSDIVNHSSFAKITFGDMKKFIYGYHNQKAIGIFDIYGERLKYVGEFIQER